MQIYNSHRLNILLMCIAGCTAVFSAASEPMLLNADEKSSAPAQNQQSDSRPSSSLDFKTYRAQIEPIFLKMRQGNVRCYDCHSVMNTRLRLQPLTAGDSTWSEEQSRQNFEVVSRLIAPNEPMKSRLLLHPLSPEAGGDPAHTGGKFWKTQSDPEWQMLAEWIRHTNPAASPAEPAPNYPGKGELDFEFFKTTVQPIFLKERAGHAR